MKRLLVAGAGSIFQFARVWRNGEGSALHAPEFTMLEWYRPGAGMDALIEEVSSLLRSVLPPVVCCRGVTSDLSRFERLTVAEAFARYAGVDLLAIGEDAGGWPPRRVCGCARGKRGRICFFACCWSGWSLG